MNSSSLPLVLNLVILVLLFECSSSFKPIRHYCKKAAKSDPNLSYGFCVAWLEANPKCHNASLEELVMAALDQTMLNATSISNHISQLLSGKEFDSYTRVALQDCLELYMDANSSLHDAIFDLRSGDHFKANLDVSAAMDSSSTCEDGLKEKEGEASPLTEENDVFFELTAVILAFMNMLH